MRPAIRMIGLILFFFLVSCIPSNPIPSQVVTAAEPSSFTPPTHVACDVECVVDTKGYEIDIACESGETTVTYGDSTSFEGQTIKLQLDQKRVYKNSGNEYKIVGNIFVDEFANKVEYDITVTGGVFGDTPQICEG
ncbi:MAG: hypothetical protein ACE5JF_10095 [Anaerolineales bacterium]